MMIATLSMTCSQVSASAGRQFYFIVFSGDHNSFFASIIPKCGSGGLFNRPKKKGC